MSDITTYLKNVHAKEIEQKGLEEIIELIRSDELSELVNKIRSAEDKGDRNKLKLELPTFFPTVLFTEKNQLTEESIVTGIIQFDVDVGDNPDMDFSEIKNTVVTIPEIIFAFISPSGGLKFGVRTDFKKNENDTLQSLKERYRQAYSKVSSYISNFININGDQNVARVKQSCFLSYDPDAYFNPDCLILEINADCLYSPPTYTAEENRNQSFDKGSIEDLLSYIPRTLGYGVRLPINFSVFSVLGSEGINILFDHWATESRTKLLNDLKTQSKSPNSYGSVGYLINQAKKYGYKPTTGNSRKQLRSKVSNHQFSPLLSVDEAKYQLDKLLDRFFSTKQSMFINVSTGFGKTQGVLEKLKSLPTTTKVLYLVGSHNLAEELIPKYKSVPIELKSPLHKSRPQSRIQHIKGKTFKNTDGETLCLRQDVAELYNQKKVIMPLDECTKKMCDQTDVCPYLAQYRNRIWHNIRLMSHTEAVLPESIWFNGVIDDGYDSVKPNLGGTKWKPDFIIIDEDWMRRTNTEETINTDFQSIRNILNSCLDGLTLLDAIQKHASLVIEDHSNFKSNAKKIQFKDTEQYIRESKESSAKANSRILTVLYNCIRHGFDEDDLIHLQLDLERKRLVLSEMTKIVDRYKNPPTLFLDATANENIVRSVIGDIDFHTLRVRSNEQTSIYQLENYCWTKQRLSEEALRNELITQLKKIISQYKHVGLITYMNIPGIENFDQWLAKELGINLYGHFGNLRGLDRFSDVDCLLIIGRHMIRINESLKYHQAIFGGNSDRQQGYMDVLVRMKDGSARTINNFVYLDIKMQQIAEHFSMSETIQAIGRGRLIYGKPKDIYLFSNEGLGDSIEITDFFRFRDTEYDDVINKIQENGFCESKLKFLKQIGLTEHHWKKNRLQFESDLSTNGIQKIKAEFRDNQRKQKQKEFYVSDINALQAHLESSGATKISLPVE